MSWTLTANVRSDLAALYSGSIKPARNYVSAAKTNTPVTEMFQSLFSLLLKE